MSANDALDAADCIGLWMAHQQDSEAVRAWEEAQRESTGSTGRDDAVDAIGALLRFVADGLTLGNMPERSIALLVVLRPDLVAGCSYPELADEIASDEGRIARAIAQLRDEFPALRGGYAYSRKGEVRRELHGRWRRQRVEARQRRAEIDMRRERQRIKALEDMRELDRRWGLA